MKQNYLAPFTILCLFAMCISTPTGSNATEEIPQSTTPAPSNIPPEAIEVRPGVYVANDPAALPLPTEGYDIYVIGERHGIHEIHQLFLEYLKMLHSEIGLRDIILEASLYGEEAVNEYVYEHSNTLPRDYRLSMEEILSPLREFNASLPEDKKIRIHFVDADNWIMPIHQHLKSIQEMIGAPARNIDILLLEEFEKWTEDEMLGLVDRLMKVAESDAVLYELHIVECSVQRLFATSGKAIIRESIIAENIQYVLKELGGTPVIALYGAGHVLKRRTLAAHSGFHCKQTWVERLIEMGISVCPIRVTAVSGEQWNYYSSTKSTTIHRNSEQILFPDGSTLGDIFDENSEYNIVYIDLRIKENETVKAQFTVGGVLGCIEDNVPLIEAFDGLVVFGRVTPEIKPEDLEEG